MSDQAQSRSLAARIGKHVAVFCGIIALWEAAAALGLIDTILLPRPRDIGQGIWELYVENRIIYRHFWITFYEATAGFVIGAGLGLALAIGRTRPSASSTSRTRSV